MDKKIIIIIITTISLMALFLCAYDLDTKKQMRITKLDNSFKLYDEKKDMDYNIDSIQLSNGIGNITGWSVVNGINSIDVKPTIILEDDHGELYRLNTRIVQRRDIAQFLNNKTDKRDINGKNFVYDNCGITSKFYIDDLKKSKKYKIGIQMEIKKVRYFIWTKNELIIN